MILVNHSDHTIRFEFENGMKELAPNETFETSPDVGPILMLRGLPLKPFVATEQPTEPTKLKRQSKK